MALKQVKNKIVATKKTGQVTKAMEAVSAVKMRKSQERALQGRPYIKSALRILARIASANETANNSFFKIGESNKKLLVIVTSDKGLAGAVNSAVLKKTDEILATSKDLSVVAIGRKAVEYKNRLGLDSFGEYVNVSDSVSVDDIEEITNTIIKKFEDGSHGTVEVVYQNFISTFEQMPTVRKVLPLNPAELNLMYQEIRVKNAKVAELAGQEKIVDYTVEPSAEEVWQTLIPQLIKIMIYHALIESKASEHSARMVAMKNATDKSKELVKSLTIKYNKARQAAITAEVSEITAGAEAMKT
ncbi:MAG: ATP synthase F1 subunit gamma [Candidatus Paceibacterota bacterium]